MSETTETIAFEYGIATVSYDEPPVILALDWADSLQEAEELKTLVEMMLIIRGVPNTAYASTHVVRRPLGSEGETIEDLEYLTV